MFYQLIFIFLTSVAKKVLYFSYMIYTLKIILDELSTSAQQALGVEKTPAIELANPRFGADYAIPCFSCAKELGKSPQQIAQDLANKLKHEVLEKVEPASGFVNLWLKPNLLAEGLSKDFAQTKPYGENLNHKDQTVIVEFPSPNMAKPFSVGHLRPANQGWALTQLMKAVGYQVITDNHLGDWGTPFGKWVVGFKKYSSDEALAKDGINELSRVYIQITTDLKAERAVGGHELADEVQQWLLRLEKGDEQALEFSKRFAKISLDHMHHIMNRLKIKTDYEYGEAFYIQQGKQLVEELVGKGIAKRQADGSVIVDLDEYNIDVPMLIEKSNGAALYATSDLATLKFRQEKWRPDKVIYVVAAEQQFHFKQLFALADKLGFKSEYVHYWFGLIDQLNDDGSREKMSSRKGVVLLEDLLNMAEEKARQQAGDSEVSKEDIVKIALGAIKFTDFAQDKKTSILFDWDRIFSLQGFSGPYIQYAAVRLGAILNKFGQGQWQKTDYNWQPEKDILLHISTYPQVVSDAAELYEPHRIAQYLYDLAKILNRYYETTQVGNADSTEKQLRLWLLSNVRKNFEHGLNLLGIEVPEKM